jgi:hypothetical protein
MAVYQALLLNTVVPQIQAAQAGDSYVMVVNATTPALRITQTGTGDAILVEDSSNPDATPFVVTAGGDVGIGTSSPAARLDLNASGSNAQMAVQNWPMMRVVGTTLDIGGYNASQWTQTRLYTNGNIAATLDASGNLGLGVAPSAWGSAYRAEDIGGVLGLTSSVNGDIWYNAYNNGTNDIYKNGGFKASLFRQNNGAFEWHNTNISAPSAGSTITLIQAMTLDASGNFLVGLTSSTAKFHVTNGASPASRLIVGAGGGAANTLYSTLAAGDYVSFETNAAEQARITSGGDLLVGTTTSSGRLTVAGVNNSSTDYGLYVTDSSGNLIIGTRNDSYVRSPATYNATSATAANVTIDSSGYLYRSTSALKYKRDIRALESIDVSKFHPVRYKSKCDGDDPTKDHFGLIADEVDAAGIKELVTYGADGEVEGFQYERLTVVLVKAIQEQQAMINELKAEVAALKGA